MRLIWEVRVRQPPEAHAVAFDLLGAATDRELGQRLADVAGRPTGERALELVLAHRVARDHAYDRVDQVGPAA